MVRCDANKEKYEYVSLLDPDLVAVDVRQIGEVLTKCLAGAKQELNVHMEKHRLVSRAKEIAGNLDGDIKRFEEYAKWKLFEKKIPKVEVKENGVEKEKKLMSEEDYFVHSKRALANLRGNIEEVKIQLSRL